MKSIFEKLATVLLVSLIASATLAQDESEESEEEEPKTIAELTESAERIEGLFTLFRDTETGKLQMLIKADQIDQEFVYFAQTANGVVEAGYFTGAYLSNAVISIHRFYDRIEFVSENFSFYFDPDNALSRAAESNISDAILAVEAIVAEDEESGDILIDADSVFLGENLLQVKYPLDEDDDPSSTFALGSLDDGKSKILNTRSYPENTDIEVEYVYHNPQPAARGNADITDSRSVSIRVLHSLIQMPDNDYQPRYGDPRIGTFDVQVTDLTTTSAVPYRDMIQRWHLVKENPEAELSDPVEPITWWIENTTPVEWRDLVRDAALAWNSAFETAGFSNAIEVQVQPDDADWDYGDIRYNVLRWTSSPNPPFGGYGPSFVNPRTGEIIGADIMLEATFMNRNSTLKWLLDESEGFDAIANNPNLSGMFCSLGHGLQVNSLVVNTFNTFSTPTGRYGDDADEQILHDTMHYLILHEIGHTLGMNHNMKSSQLLSPEEAFDMDKVNEIGLGGSVMDYPAVNFPPAGYDITRFYMVAPGPYDHWYMQYAYTPDQSDEQLETILSRSTEPELAFGNDADDMRSPGKGLDPRVNIYDMTSDAVSYASQRIQLVQETLNEISREAIDEGNSYQEIYDGTLAMLRELTRSAGVVSRYIGGVYVDRAMAGQAGGSDPFTPIEEEKQKQAMQVLTDQVFTPEVFTAGNDLLRYVAPQRRGFNHYGDTEDPKIHDAILQMQSSVLNHLLNPAVMKRITDTQLYGNTYSLGEVMTDLTDAIFLEDARTSVNSFRQNLQMEYVQRLTEMVKEESQGRYHYQAQSLAVFNLSRISELIDRKRNPDIETEAHVQNLQLIIDRALSTLG